MKRTTTILALAMLAALTAGCASQRMARSTPAVGEGERLAQLHSDWVEQRQVDQKTQRWLQRKQLCRQFDVRFDRSGLCW